MLTARGWAALGAGSALGVLWVVFGEAELLAVAIFLVLAIAVGWLLMRRIVPDVGLTRTVTPTQVHEGDRATVEIDVLAHKPLRGSILEDTVEKLGTARHALGRLEKDTRMRARYEILCRPRGIYKVGPGILVVTDPFGMVERRYVAGFADRLVVYPRIEELTGLPLLRGIDPSVQSSEPTFAPHGGEDFYTLREYRLGDDLRRVHWPATAKRDELMIRQLEIPWQSRALVLLDTRAGPYPTSAAFEHAVTGAASVVHHFWAAGLTPEVWLADGIPVAGASRYHAAMERLAAAETAAGVDLRTVAAKLTRRGLSGGALVVVTGRPDDNLLASYQALSRDYARAFLMIVTAEETELTDVFRRGGVATAVVGPDEPWGPAWTTAMRSTWPTASAG